MADSATQHSSPELSSTSCPTDSAAESYIRRANYSSDKITITVMALGADEANSDAINEL